MSFALPWFTLLLLLRSRLQGYMVTSPKPQTLHPQTLNFTLQVSGAQETHLAIYAIRLLPISVPIANPLHSAMLNRPHTSGRLTLNPKPMLESVRILPSSFWQTRRPCCFVPPSTSGTPRKSSWLWPQL